MNLNLKRHKLLGLLSDQRIGVELEKEGYNVLGVTFVVILKHLDCNKDELQLITSELYTSDEIGYHDVGNGSGLFAKDNGLTSFSNEKYVKLNNKIIKNNIKDFVQIIIPILSLIVAILAISIKINSLNSRTEKEIKAIEQKQELILEKIDKLEKPIEIHPTEKKNDSLKMND